MDPLELLPGHRVLVRKVQASKTPVEETGTWEECAAGSAPEKSLPLNYEMEGVLVEPVEIGGRIALLRFSRNAVVSDGLFFSTPIIVRNGSLVETFNSVYLVIRRPGRRFRIQTETDTCRESGLE